MLSRVEIKKGNETVEYLSIEFAVIFGSGIAIRMHQICKVGAPQKHYPMIKV